MEKMKIEVEVSKPFYELGNEIKSLVNDIAEHTKDGAQLTDIVSVLMPRVSKIGELKKIIAALPEEMKAPWDAIQALTASLEGIEKPFLKSGGEAKVASNGEQNHELKAGQPQAQVAAAHHVPPQEQQLQAAKEEAKKKA